MSDFFDRRKLREYGERLHAAAGPDADMGAAIMDIVDEEFVRDAAYEAADELECTIENLAQTVQALRDERDEYRYVLHEMGDCAPLCLPVEPSREDQDALTGPQVETIVRECHAVREFLIDRGMLLPDDRETEIVHLLKVLLS